MKTTAMTPENKKESKDPGEWIIGGILFGVFILLGIAIEWLGLILYPINNYFFLYL